MRRLLFILCTALVLTGCKKEETPGPGDQVPPTGSEEVKNYTFEAKTEANGGTQASATRYLMELYEGNLEAKPTKMSNANGRFEVKLKKDVTYISLFWADNGPTAYNASDLQSVIQADEAIPATAAYFAKSTTNTLSFNGAVKLNSAVAQIDFTDKSGIATDDNTILITYPYTEAKFNVNTGAVSYAAGTTLRTIKNIPASAAGAAFASDLILAPAVKSQIQWLRLKLNNLPEKTIASIDIQANIKTEVISEEEVEVVKPKLLDFFYSDRSYSSTYISTKTCVGIIYWLDPASPMSGKIISLDENPGLDWNAATNWKSSKVLPEGMSWILPNRDELQHIYSAYNGAEPATWDNKPTVQQNPGAQDIFNNTLIFSSTGYANDRIGVPIKASEHWSSTESHYANATFGTAVTFTDGYTFATPKNDQWKVRNIATF